MLRALESVIQPVFNSFGLEIRRLRTPNFEKGKKANQNVVAEIARHVQDLAPETRYCIDIGASDGISMSNSYALYAGGWKGLAVEFDATLFSYLAKTYIKSPNVNLAKCMVTPENVLALFGGYQVPQAFGFLSLDIDGYDYFVLDQILSTYRPAVICAEINEKIPPPIKFTVKWNPEYFWHGDHFFGQSISQLYTLCKKHNYALVQLHYNNAFLVPEERNRQPSLTPEEAYRAGYTDKPDRKANFPWNDNVEAVLQMKPEEALSFFTRFFEKYKGMFDISL